MQIEILNVAEINSQDKEQKPQFNKFKQEEKGVYSVLCPQIKRYAPEDIVKDVDIPDRIIELVESTKDRFYKYEVWEANSVDTKDPIIIGREKTYDKDGKEQSSWYDKEYFLGRWGEELESFSKLKEKAIKLLAKNVKREFLKIKAQADMYLQDIELFVEEGINKGEVELPTFSGRCLAGRSW